MKIKNLFIALFAASTLFACSEDDESPVPDNKGTIYIRIISRIIRSKNQIDRSRKFPDSRYNECQQHTYQSGRR